LEIDHILEGSKSQILELKRALENASLSRSPAFESLKLNHDQKQRFTAILESFRNAAVIEMQRIIHATGGYVSLSCDYRFCLKTDFILLPVLLELLALLALRLLLAGSILLA
jgi:hypothetical protein